MDPPPRQVLAGAAWPLHDTAATRTLESAASAATPAHALMQRAGLACARLAMALAPHARTVWVAAGPGNNGGDGMEAAMHLQRWGRQVIVTCIGDPATAPADAAASRQRALQAGVAFADEVPAQWDLCIDALLGIGATRPPQGVMAQWIARMNAAPGRSQASSRRSPEGEGIPMNATPGRSQASSQRSPQREGTLMNARDAPVLAIDNPTGLDADTGNAAPDCVVASATICLLTLKPGLFTADGRDMAGRIWLDTLQSDTTVATAMDCATAWLITRAGRDMRRHASHKGNYGDVAVVGGAPGMAGAAVLAASASLHAGAGRVFLCALDLLAAGVVPTQPELMLRDIRTLAIDDMTVVCGCGGGDAVREHLPGVLSRAATLVLDADALNAVATDSQLQQLLARRAARGAATVLTPHPLEAARLLETTARDVQANRLDAAQCLAARYRCTVVLKGSGTVVAAPDHTPAINPTGNALLATAGSGDVLAGLIGARLAAGLPAFDAACTAVFQHGEIADQWPANTALTAAALARALY